jgi:hypothetical protein
VTRVNDRDGAPGRNALGHRLVHAILLAFCGLAMGLPIVAAHDGFTGIILEPDHANPGGVIAVRGDNISTDEALHVELVVGATRIDLATVVTDGVGHFSAGVNIPTDLAVGAYVIEAVSPSGGRMTAPLTVEGTPIFNGQDGAPPGRDEGLPALPPARGQPAPMPVAVAGAASASEVDLVPFVALALAVGGLGLLVWRTRRSQASQA